MRSFFDRLVRFYKKSPNEFLRRAAQAVTVAIFAVAAVEFASFLDAVKGAVPLAEAYRPPVVEGFLPIAGLVALRAWAATGIIDPVHPAGLVILSATLVTALVFRRALCSWLCPVGTFSEFLGKVGERLGRSYVLPRWLDLSLLAVKYLLFALVFKFLFLMDAAEAISFMRLPYYAVSDIKMFELFANIGLVGISAIAVLAISSVFVKSFWCRYLCPYGALQGLIGLMSPFSIRRDPALCTSCNVCSKSCPNRVDVAKAKGLVITPECTGCTACVSSCPQKGALRLRILGKFGVRPLVFGAAFLALFFGFVAAAKITGHWESKLTLPQYRALYKIMGGQ